jgi:hypothetical protein
MNKLAPVVGYHMFYTACMKNGGFNPVIDKLTDIWIGKNDAPPGPQRPPSTKGVISRDKVLEPDGQEVPEQLFARRPGIEVLEYGVLR